MDELCEFKFLLLSQSEGSKDLLEVTVPQWKREPRLRWDNITES